MYCIIETKALGSRKSVVTALIFYDVIEEVYVGHQTHVIGQEAVVKFKTSGLYHSQRIDDRNQRFQEQTR